MVSAPFIILSTVWYFNGDMSILPASKIAILRFISYLALFYKPSTIKSYLSAVCLCISSTVLTFHWKANPEFSLSFEELSVCQVTPGGCVAPSNLFYCSIFAAGSIFRYTIIVYCGLLYAFWVRRVKCCTQEAYSPLFSLFFIIGFYYHVRA